MKKKKTLLEVINTDGEKNIINDIIDSNIMETKQIEELAKDFIDSEQGQVGFVLGFIEAKRRLKNI